MLILGSLGSELSGEAAGKLNVLLTDSDDESEMSNEGLIEEGKLEEIMQEFYKEITGPHPYNASQPMVTLPSPSSSSSSSPHPPPLFSATSDVKSETCGASLSDSSSSVMAGVAFDGKLPDVNAGLPGAGKMSPGTEMEGCEGEEDGNDQWMRRVLEWGPLEIEDWT